VGDERDITPGGSEIRRHDEPRPPEPVPSGWAGQELIEAHVEQHLGPIETVFHELVSEYVHLDVLIVEATDERPVHHLVTSGMSSRPMEDGSLAELMIVLPRAWPLDEESWRERRHFWPVELLKSHARMPHEYGFELGHGHSIPNGDPPEPYSSDTDLCGALVLPGLTVPKAFWELETPKGSVRFYALWLLHEDEMNFKLEHGTDALLDAFERAHVTEEVDIRRRSALRKKRFGLF
jgi:suppressor of fused protein SUFU